MRTAWGPWGWEGTSETAWGPQGQEGMLGTIRSHQGQDLGDSLGPQSWHRDLGLVLLSGSVKGKVEFGDWRGPWSYSGDLGHSVVAWDGEQDPALLPPAPTSG